jgi:D-sedoheptulose 7-phosphate isomerase
MNNFYKTYFDEYSRLIVNSETESQLNQFKELALKVKQDNGKIMFGGNGASASIADHGAVDFTKQGGIRARTFNESNLITCFSNDYGFENWLAKAVNFYADPSDLLVLISVSGESENAIRAAKEARNMGIPVVTFSGRHNNNNLKKNGDLNFWVDSHAYNIVECIHMIWITAVIDSIIGKAIYEVS